MSKNKYLVAAFLTLTLHALLKDIFDNICY